MSWRGVLTSVLLVAAAALLIFVALKARALSQKVEEQRAEIATHQARYAQTLQRQESLNVELARRRAQVNVLDEALATNEAILEGLETARTFLGGLCGAGGGPRIRMPDIPEATDLLNRCSYLRIVIDQASTRLPRGYSDVAGLRVRADTEADFRQLEQRYRALLARLPQDGGNRRWRSLAHEGIGYASYRLGSLRDAGENAETALQLDPGSAFAALTAIKISCAGPTPADQIRRRYDDQRRQLQRRVDESPPGTARDSARRQISYFLQDPELPLVCARARIPGGR